MSAVVVEEDTLDDTNLDGAFSVKKSLLSHALLEAKVKTLLDVIVYQEERRLIIKETSFVFIV